MSDPSRQQFSIKRGEALGDRLIWRYPMGSEAGRTALAGLGNPGQVTVGYFRRLSDPPGAICFMPVKTPMAIAALGVPAVLRRIGEDLAMALEAQSNERT